MSPLPPKGSGTVLSGVIVNRRRQLLSQPGCWGYLGYLGPPGVHDNMVTCYCHLGDLCSGQEHLTSGLSAKEDQIR